MMEFLLASQNLPFTVALAVMLAIAVLEGITTLLGAGISSFLDTLVPDADLDIDVDGDVGDSELDVSGALSRMLGWLHVGKVPILMLLVIFLTAFGLLGLGLQSLAQNILRTLLPGLLAAGLAFMAALPVVRFSGALLARIMPQDETEAVSEQTFIGRVAVITLGQARKGKPTQAKLRDQYGQAHYILVEPDLADDVFETGASVMLVSRQGAVFRGIRNPSAALVDE